MTMPLLSSHLSEAPVAVSAEVAAPGAAESSGCAAIKFALFALKVILRAQITSGWVRRLAGAERRLY